jgi:hypothetical protein
LKAVRHEQRDLGRTATFRRPDQNQCLQSHVECWQVTQVIIVPRDTACGLSLKCCTDSSRFV